MKFTQRGSGLLIARTSVGAAILAMAVGATVLLPTQSHAIITKKVETNCEKDYKRFCNAYSIGTPELRKCMESNRRRLSRKCKRALVDAGEVPRRLLKSKR